jgi:hypothetical protein
MQPNREPLAKSLVRGTFRHKTALAEMVVRRLITRRSQVQILPPPPTNQQVRPHFSEWGLLLFGAALDRASPGQRSSARRARSSRRAAVAALSGIADQGVELRRPNTAWAVERAAAALSSGRRATSMSVQWPT